MNIIKHILCVSFALTAWNAYGMFGMEDALAKKIPAWKQQEMEAVAYGLTIVDSDERRNYFDTFHAIITSPEWLEIVQRSPNAKNASNNILDGLPYSELIKAQQKRSPSKIQHPTPQTTPHTSPTKLFLDNKSTSSQKIKESCARRLTFDKS